MCGIAGFVGQGDVSIIRRMISTLAHRGPDDETFYSDPQQNLFLGHRRLSILDLENGRQPMWNEDSTVGVIFNGEIYNHRELRDALAAQGHRFRSDHSDTEVLVHGYEQWGRDLPLRLNGMFAFAIYDRTRRRLFLARDRFGEKPLFYAKTQGAFLFASEIGALKIHPSFDSRIDSAALQKYFAWGYLPAPHCLSRDGRKLPGGCHLIYDFDTENLSVAPYWQFRLAPDPALTPERESELAEELRQLFFQAVRRRLISDVPLGISLSGGIDSSAVVAAVAASGNVAAMETFSIGFDDPSFDESRHARLVAETFGTRHHERRFPADPDSELIADVLGRIDEPLADPSILPTYQLSRFTREYVTVTLSGDGGDELFAGYDPFRALAPARLYHAVLSSGMRRAVRRLSDLMPISVRNMSLDFKLRRTLLGLSYGPSVWNPAWMSLLEPELIAEVFEAPLDVEQLYGEAIALWTRPGAGDAIDRSLEFYTNFYLPDDILTKVDRASMLVSLETRAVFLDNDLVAFCERLPNHFKYRHGSGKYLLKKALSGIIPDSILARPKKGFGIPLRRWLNAMPERDAIQRDHVRPQAVERLLREDRTGVKDHRLFRWGLVALDAMGTRSAYAAAAQ